MITATFSELRQSEWDYVGILSQLRKIEARIETTTTPRVIGRTITLVALSTKFRIKTTPRPPKDISEAPLFIH